MRLSVGTHFALIGFVLIFCSSSLAIGKGLEEVKTYLELKKLRSRCAGSYLYDADARMAAQAIVNGEIELKSFSAAFQASCSYRDSLAASKNQKTVKVYTRLSSLNTGCRIPYMTSEDALTAATAAARGEIDENLFIEAYSKSCNLSDSLARSRVVPSPGTSIRIQALPDPRAHQGLKKEGPPEASHEKVPAASEGGQVAPAQ